MRKFMSIVENSLNPVEERVEYLEEDAVLPNGDGIRLSKNLGVAGLNQMVANAPDNHVRGLVVGGDIFYWPAFDAVHFEVAKALGVEFDPDDRLEIWDHGGVVTVDFEVPPIKNRSFQNLLQSEKLHFNLDGQFVSGAEIIHTSL